MPMLSKPGAPHDTIPVHEAVGTKIDSAFIGSCTNGRMSDLLSAADILRGRKVAPGVILKIVPATDAIWNECLDKGLITIFKKAGALVSNAGCAGCAAGQVGQNGPGEITISTGNRNFPGKQGKGNVYLASPETVAASAVAGFITTPDKIPESPAEFTGSGPQENDAQKSGRPNNDVKKTILEGKAWIVPKDNIDTDMIFHNRYLAITDPSEMGQYTFDNLEGYENFAGKFGKGDFVIAGKNFGSGSSRQQAVDCFTSLGIQALIAESFGAIYERNAINAAFPVIVAPGIGEADFSDGDYLKLDLENGELLNTRTGKIFITQPFSEVQMKIYKRGGLLGN